MKPYNDWACLSLVFNVINTGMGLVGTVIYLLLGVVLFWRSGNERTAMLFGFFMIPFLSANFSYPPGLTSPLVSFFMAMGFILGIYGWVYLFPTGRFVSRWAAIFFFVQLGVFALVYIFPELQEIPFGGVFFIIGIGGMIYRYRRAGRQERQQMKWLLLIFSGIVFVTILNLVIGLVPASPLKDVLTIISYVGFSIFVSIWPIAVVFAIFRYRLWDIDLFINRSLVYGALTLLLALIFAGIIALASTLTQGQGQLIGVAAAAVVSGVLFNPARRAIQHFVDRRIYRLRYDLNEVADAQKTPEVKNPGLYTGRTFGKYQILGVLGKGGMGEVYKGVNGNEVAAVKVLPEELSRKEDFRKRFEREAKTLASLEHPNIVKLYDSGVTEDGVRYLAMELIDGRELGDVVNQSKISDYEMFYDWMKTIASALDYIHEKGLVHRDLKPSNIMLRPSARDREISEAVLMDFGIARVDASGTRITGSGAVGTIDYMSPEQITAAREVDKRSDIYALGVIVYELVTGERPFSGSAGHVLFAHLQQPAPDPRVVNPTVPRPIANAVLRALSKSPDDRFESAGEFAAALG